MSIQIRFYASMMISTHFHFSSKLRKLHFKEKLFVKSNIIPQELPSIDPPMCPGCAYGKAWRKQWRYKGMKILKKIYTYIPNKNP